MQLQTVTVTFGCLLRYMDMLYQRSNTPIQLENHPLYQPEWESVLTCIQNSSAQSNDLSCIMTVSEHLSAAQQGSVTTNQNLNAPLYTIFTHMNGEHPNLAIPASLPSEKLQMPENAKNVHISSDLYVSALNTLENGLRQLTPDEKWINPLLDLLESCMSTFPASTENTYTDLSLYDRTKITAAIGSCISEYLSDQKATNYYYELVEHEDTFQNKKTFLLYSADFSGIQKFIYTVATSNALKSLRSRSFFLELLMEHYIDELLRACGVSRANLLYSGGGHCYILLPNTAHVTDVLSAWNRQFNDWLTRQFGISLFLAHGWTACSGNELINIPAENSPYQAMFRRVSSAIAWHKLHRYTASQLLALNTPQSPSGRECKVCGRTDHLTKDNYCPWCNLFVTLSERIQHAEVYIVSRNAESGQEFSVPALNGTAYFTFTQEKVARARLDSGEPITKIYVKNRFIPGLSYSTRLYVGDYAASNSMQTLARHSTGIRRIAVCRMDVDNLGQAFVAGFEQNKETSPEKRQQYVNLSRTSAFSRQMSLFFKYHINTLLSGSYENQSALAVSIVYSGGDDVFLVGAWNDVIEAACRIRNALQKFTCGALTISGGITLFDDHFPIRVAADQTAALEDRAKDQPDKNAISLFDPLENHTYSWEDFQTNVMGEKLEALRNFFHEDQEHGMSFLYRLMELLRQAQKTGEKINLARYAYVLARLEPSRSSPKTVQYRMFADRMYKWALDPIQRGELISAIYLYVYESRKEQSENEQTE